MIILASQDDPSLPTFTFRVVVLGSLFTTMGAVSSQILFVETLPTSLELPRNGSLQLN